MLKIYNTLSHQVEEFEPQNPPTVTMYTCGPTVYNFMHIGNLRTFVFSDILFRTLKYNGFKVEAAENITDIDDKIIKKAKEENKIISEITQEYTKYFLEDIRKLNINPENLKEQPRATEYVEKMIEFIKVLLEKEVAYVEHDGSVYFDISKFSNYGKLSGVEKRELKSGTRMLSDEYTKDDVQDFALWKAVQPDEVGYDSPWGKGRPGWHIECSVMSQSILGNKLDIHTGGIDLVFPHHENEIAQSEAKTGEAPFVKYWVHGAHMLVDGKKMSKSLHNFYTLSEIIEKGFDPLSLRYLFLQTHYRQEMNFTLDALDAAQNALKKLWDEARVFENRSFDYKSDREPSANIKKRLKEFKDAVDNDLNMPMALASLHQGLKEAVDDHDQLYIMQKTDEVLGLDLEKNGKRLSNEYYGNIEVQKLRDEREKLRKEKKYAEADKIREKIIEMGFKVEDKV